MKKSFLISKIGVVSTSILMGVMICATVIAQENATAINNFLGIIPYNQVETDPDSEKDTEYYKSKYQNLNDLFTAGKKNVSEIEGDGATLLKNSNNALPLAKNNKVSLFSVSSIDPAYGGKGSAQVSNPQPPVTPKEGLEAAGLDVNDTLLDFYANNYNKYKRSGRGPSAKINDAPWTDISNDSTVSSSIREYKDAAIFIIARPGGGEGSDFSASGTDGENGNYLRLNENEKSVLENLNILKKEGAIDKIIVLMNTSNHMECDFIDDTKYGIDACMWIGTTGISGFEAVGKLLVGDINPSGHMSDTLWFKHKDNPVHANFGRFEYPNYNDYELPTTGINKYNSYVTYQEGIYLGYRYAETRYYDVVTNKDNAGNFDFNSTIYKPFGFGDSYTDFEYSNFSISNKGEKVEVKVTVKNTGDVAGKDAVQIYAQKPYTRYDIEHGIEKSAVELVGFAKTSLLEPNKEEVITVDVDKYTLTSYDAEVEKTYIIEEGDYYFTAGQDSHDAINNILALQGYDTTKGMDKNGNEELSKKLTLSKDYKTYSESKATGRKITNLFDESDINKYHGRNDNKVDYVSRNNWTGTLPNDNTDYVKLEMTSALAKDLIEQDDMSKLTGNSKPQPVYGKDSGLSLISLLEDEKGNPIEYENDIWDTLIDQLSFEELDQLLSVGLRKTIGLGNPINKPETVEHNGPAGLVSMYGANPNGLASRVNDPNKDTLNPPYYPCIGLVAATFNTEMATKFGDMLGEDAIWSGYAGLYGIGLNTHRSAYEGRAYEYWSEDPLLAGKMVAKQVKALQAHGCNGYIKHFALNEQETQRNGIQVWLSEQTLREIYLKPFEYAVVEGGAANAMASFSRIGALNCPASKALMTDFLRGECGMTGFVVTDMYAIGYSNEQFPAFVMAGTDLCDGEISGIFAQFKTGHSDVVHKMRESARRILYTTLHSNAMNGLSSTTILVPYTPWWQITLVVIDVAFGVLLAGAIGYASYVYLALKRKTN